MECALSQSACQTTSSWWIHDLMLCPSSGAPASCPSFLPFCLSKCTKSRNAQSLTSTITATLQCEVNCRKVWGLSENLLGKPPSIWWWIIMNHNVHHPNWYENRSPILVSDRPSFHPKKSQLKHSLLSAAIHQPFAPSSCPSASPQTLQHIYRHISQPGSRTRWALLDLPQVAVPWTLRARKHCFFSGQPCVWVVKNVAKPRCFLEKFI